MSETLFFADRIITPDTEVRNAAIHVRNGMIVDIVSPSPSRRDGISVHDFEDCTLVPGFIDTHIHGAMGRETIEGKREALDTIGRYLVTHGVTGWLPTTIAAPLDEIAQAFQTVRDARDKPTPGTARVLGGHMEGPYIHAGRRGGQREPFIRAIDVNECLDLCTDVVRVVSMAPELEGGLELVKTLADRGIRPSVGHSDATYEQVIAAVPMGLCSVTHGFNAMSPLHHRQPGVVGAALAEPSLDVEVIADLVHVHPGAIRVLLKAKTVDRLLLVSDSIPAAGLPDGDYPRGGRIMFIRNGEARLENGTLSGSTTNMAAEIQNLVKAGLVSLPEAVGMASVNPAERLGIGDRYGRLKAGYAADFVALNENLDVCATVMDGQVVFDAPHQ